MKKLYIEPELELANITLLVDVLGNSQFNSDEDESQFVDPSEDIFDDDF